MTAQGNRGPSTIPRWLAISASGAIFGLGLMLIVLYRVPWGGRFNPTIAGPVSGWVSDLFTGLGILGLIYQLSQLRISRTDETTREINSLYTRISIQTWNRGMVLAGKLVYIYLQNDGERKAMDIKVSTTLLDGSPVPPEWLIEKNDGFSLPPSMPEPVRALLFHIPSSEEARALGEVGRPIVTVSWTDAWRRRVEMTDNMPSHIVSYNPQAVTTS